MKKKIFLILGIILLIIVFLSFYIYNHDNLRFKFSYEIYNDISYSNGKKIRTSIPSDNNVVYIKREDDLVKCLTTGNRVIYFGYSTCPWCRNIISPLLEVIKDNNIDKLYYVDVESIETTDEKIKEILDGYLSLDSTGNKRLYVPDVYFIKDGNIVFHHIGTVDSYKNPYKGMSSEEKQQLKGIYQEGIDLIKRKEE